MAVGVKNEVDILLDLVAIPSVSALSNRPVIDYALDYLDNSVWHTELFEYRDGTGEEKANLVAMSRARGMLWRESELALVCHTDTVPFDPAWQDAVNPEVRNGDLFGRGSCDVKGFLACILASVSQMDMTRLRKPLAIVLTADEEIGCIGAKYLAGKARFRSRFAIVGEPTGLHAVRAGKGYALGEIIVSGKEAHSAFPDRGRSAIRDAARVIDGLDRVARKLSARKNRNFDPAYTTLNVGVIQGGTAKNIIPGECRLTVEWRPIPGQDPKWAAELIEAELRLLARRFPGLRARFNVKRMDPAFEPSATDDLAKLVQSITRRRPTTVSFGTEAPHMAKLADEVIVCGPGNMGTAHTNSERVPIAELSKCVSLLKLVIERLCE